MKKVYGFLIGIMMVGTIFTASGNTIVINSDSKINISKTSDDPEWITQIVDEEGNVGLYSDLIVDGIYQFLCYYDQTNGDLKYATWNGEDWNRQVVDSAGDVGLYSSLAFDFMGNPCISYYDQTNGDLKYAYWDPFGEAGGYWVSEIVDSVGDVGWNSNLIVSESYIGDIIIITTEISYYDATNNKLKYATKISEDPNWYTTIIDDGGLYNDMVVDSEGTQHIAYTGENGGVKYCYYEFNPDGGGWWVDTVVDSDGEGWDISLACDSNDRLHLSYYKNGKLYYTYKSGESFTPPVIVDDVIYGGWGSSIATFDNNAFISYYMYDTKDLYYRPMNEETGVPLLTEGDVGLHSSIYVYDGLVHVSCYDNTNKDLIKVFQQKETEGDLYIFPDFQPVQTVYPSDPVYGEDIGGYNHVKGKGWVRECGLNMVAGKNTYIFGHPYAKRDKVNITVLNLYKEDKKFCFTLTIKPGEKEIWRSPEVTAPGNSKVTSFLFDAPIPDKPFQWERWADDSVNSKDGEIVLSVDPKPSPDWKDEEHILKMKINKTHDLYVKFVAWTFKNGPDFPQRLKDWPTPYDSYIASDLHPWWKAIYPLAENDLSTSRGCVNVKTTLTVDGILVDDLNVYKNTLNNSQRLEARKQLYAKAYASKYAAGYDRAVFIVPRNFSKEADGLAMMRDHDGDHKYSVLVSWNTSRGDILMDCTPAHEVGHTYGLDDNYNWEGGNRYWGDPAPGYWVNKKIDVPNNQKTTRDLMGYTNQLWNEEKNNQTWIKKPNFKSLLERFTLYKDPEVLGISGFIDKNNNVELNPWYQLEEGNIDLEWDTTGDYLVKAYNTNEDLLKTAGFTLSFTGSLDFIGEESFDETIFGFRLEWLNGINRIDIVHKASNQLLASKTKSSNPPQITITSPRSGEEIKPGIFTITWDGNDNDGDQLTYNLLYSNNSGQTWEPIWDTTTENSYTLDFSNLEKNNYKLKVMVTDGWNVGEDLVDFSVKTVKSKTTFPLLNLLEKLIYFHPFLYYLTQLFLKN